MKTELYVTNGFEKVEGATKELVIKAFQEAFEYMEEDPCHWDCEKIIILQYSDILFTGAAIDSSGYIIEIEDITIPYR